MPTVTFRLSDDELADLHGRARAGGKSLSQVIREALGLASAVPDVAERLEAVERRLGRLEDVAGL